jgi:hypothetical protein
MAITVVIARDDSGAPSTREVYETGVKFSAEGGDLSVFSSKPQLLGTYGSGNWLSVYVDESVEVICTKPAEGEEDSDSGFGDFDFGSDDSSDDDSSSEETGDDDSSSDESSDDDSSSEESSDEEATTF